MPALDTQQFFRVLLGTVLGGVIGFERDLHGRPAGLRTHALVALASATFMVVSTRFVYFQGYAKGDLVQVDPSRIASCVVSGIGFLGAGAILRNGFTVRGLTTAASLWLVSAIGMTAGGGMYAVAAFVTLVALVTLTLLRHFEDRGEPVARLRIGVVVDDPDATVPAMLATLAKPGTHVALEEYERRHDASVRVTLEVRASKPVDGHELARTLAGIPGARDFKIERA
jgi:putative Mg2+ transporter-C (MgtC) family protein